MSKPALERPLATAIGYYIGGLVLADLFSPDFLFTMIGLVLGFITLGLAILQAGGNWRKPLYGVMLFLAMANTAFAQTSVYQLQPYQGEEIAISGKIEQVPVGKHYLDIEANTINDHALRHPCVVRVRLAYQDKNTYVPGSGATFTGILTPPKAPRNPGGFDERHYLKSKGIFYTVQSLSPGQVTQAPTGIVAFSNDLKAWVKMTLQSNLPADQVELVMAVLFGDTGLLDQDFYSLSQKFGIIHVFSVSGLHVSIVLACLLAVARFFKREKSWLTIILIAMALILYTFMSGLAVSALRATIMAIIGLVAYKLLRYKDMMTIIAIAAMALLLANPYVLWDIGFQLSFLTTWGLIYFYPLTSKWLAFVPCKPLSASLGVALSAQLTSAPVVAWYFYMFSAYSPLLNLLIVPLFSVVVPLVLVGLLVAFFLPFLQGVVFALVGFCLNMIDFLLALFQELIGSGHFYIGQPKLWAILIYFGLLILYQEGRLNFLGRWRNWLASGIMVLIVVVGFGPQALSNGIMFLDVGQGSSAISTTTSRRIVVYDGGISRYETANYLRYCGINRITAIVISHGDLDHIGGLREVLRDFRVAHLFLTAEALATPELAGTIALAQAQGTQIQVIEGRASLHIDGGHQLYLQKIGTGSGDNAVQLVALYHGEQVGVLFPGDLNTADFSQIAFRPALIHVVAVAHHGSKNSWAGSWYAQVQPQLAIISCGVANRFGHPHAEVTTGLRQLGIPYYRTDETGGLLLTDGNEGLMVSPYLAERDKKLQF